jgi:hypothetical protein
MEQNSKVAGSDVPVDVSLSKIFGKMSCSSDLHHNTQFEDTLVFLVRAIGL